MGGDKTFLAVFGSLLVFIGLVVLGAGIWLLSADPPSLTKSYIDWILVAAGSVVTAIGAFLLWHALAAMARDRRIVDFGVALVATVIDIRRSVVTINHQSRWHVRYRYTYGGDALEGESRMLSGTAAGAFRPGDSVRIVIDPQRPQNSVFLGAV